MYNDCSVYSYIGKNKCIQFNSILLKSNIHAEPFRAPWCQRPFWTHSFDLDLQVIKLIASQTSADVNFDNKITHIIL